jgi:hypothetical protein
VFHEMLNDKVNLVRQNGERADGIKAAVSSKSIVIDDAHLVIEEGDKIERPLANGRVEMYVVLDAGYHNAFHGIPAHYQLKVRKESSLVPDSRGSTVYNLHGAHSRVNIHSHDESLNVAVAGDAQVFQSVREAIEQAQLPTDVTTELLEGLRALQEAVGRPTYLERYQAFITSAANHMTVLAPFIPALSQMLTR